MAKRKLLLFCLLSVLTIHFCHNAIAFPLVKKKHKHKKEQTTDQPAPLTRHERKELKKKEKQERKKEKSERKKKRRDERYASHHKSVAVVKKRQEFVYPPTVMKPRYRIDVLAQMYLDEIKNDKIPEKGQAGLAFYEGLNIAADSLKRAGYSVDIYVHDVASAAENAEQLISKNILDSSDLIVAAVVSHDIDVLAEYAKAKHINFVSTLSASDGGVRNDQFFTMIQPSLKTHCEWINADIARKFPGMKVGLLYRTATQPDADAYGYITGDDSDRLSFGKLCCNTIPGKDSLSRLFDSTRPNVVLISVLDPMAADSILKELSRDFPATHFEVYGMPSWGNIPNLRKDDAFPNLSINITTPFNIDRSGILGHYIATTFHRDYGGTAPELAYRGFETMYWYAGLLRQYGTIFNNNYSDNAAAPFTHFEVKPRWDKDGQVMYLENAHVFLTRYEGGAYKTE